MKTKVWKVVRLGLDGKLTSVYVPLASNACAVYEVGVETLPPIKGSLLLAFSTLEAAKDFLHDGAGFEVMRLCEAEARVSRRRTVGARVGMWMRTGDVVAAQVERTWRLRALRAEQAVGRADVWGSWPPGTVFCNGITLTKLVE